MEIENEALEDFKQEIEQDKYMRSKFNLIRDDEAITKIEQQGENL